MGVRVWVTVCFESCCTGRRGVNRICSLGASSLGCSGGGAERKRNLQLHLWNMNICYEKVDVKCWLALWRHYPWHVFFNVCLHSCLFPLHADWQKFDSPVDGMAQGNWRWNSSSRDVVASSPSFSCPTTRAPGRACSQATECVVTTCIWYWVQVLEHSSDSVCIQSVEPSRNKGPRGWQNVFMIVRFCYIKVILLLLGQKILFVIPRTLLCGGSLYSGSTVF